MCISRHRMHNFTAARLDRKVGGADSNGKDPGARERVLLSRSSQVNVGGVSPVRVSEEGYGAHSLSYSLFLCLVKQTSDYSPPTVSLRSARTLRKSTEKAPKSTASCSPAPRTLRL